MNTVTTNEHQRRGLHDGDLGPHEQDSSGGRNHCGVHETVHLISRLKSVHASPSPHDINLEDQLHTHTHTHTAKKFKIEVASEKKNKHNVDLMKDLQDESNNILYDAPSKFGKILRRWSYII